MSDTPETDGIEFNAQIGMMPPHDKVSAEFARRLKRERDELREVIRNVHNAFPDLAEFQDKDGRQNPKSERRRMSDTPETDLLCGEVVPAKFARYLERERDELRQVIRDVDRAFPDLAEFQDKNGRSLKWLADKIQNAKGEA